MIERGQADTSAAAVVDVLDALGGWARWPSPDTEGVLATRLARLASAVGVASGELEIRAEPLPHASVSFGPGGRGRPGEVRSLHGAEEAEVFGQLAVHGDAKGADELARILASLVDATRARLRGGRAAQQLIALDQAVRGINAVLEPKRVLQQIVDQVRELVQAQYAALGIVNETDVIQQFITSGISDDQRRAIGDLPRGHGLLGLIIRENRSYRIDHIASNSESYGFPPHHPAMDSFLGVPVIVKGRTVGRLYLTNKAGERSFSTADEELVEMFALHAGIAIDNATLHQQVQRLAVVDERDRISRDLHDSVIQSIYGVTLSLDDVPDLAKEDPAEAGRRIDSGIDALHAVIRDIRNFIFGLRPVLLDFGGLREGLETLGDELRRSTAVTVEVDAEDVADLPVPLLVEVLAIAREALSNIARHAGASRARLVLRTTPDDLRLEIHDDGRGFDVEGRTEAGHRGLGNIASRARSVGGDLAVTSEPGGGTTIFVTLPRGMPTEDR